MLEHCFDFNDKKRLLFSHLSFTMQVCKNQSANFRYLFRHVSLHREATWPRHIQPFAVPTTSQGGCQLKVLAAPGWGCLCGPSWEHQIYEKTTSVSLPEKHLQESGSFLSLLSPKHISALREHPSRRERCWSRCH